MHPMEPHLVHSEIVLVSVQDNYPVCAKCITDSEIILDAHKELIGDMSYVESCFGPFGYNIIVGQFRDSANLDAR
jgi:hypothetical protein